MANFCMYCGKKLMEGETCSCPQAQENKAAAQAQTEQAAAQTTASAAQNTAPTAPVVPPEAVEVLNGFIAGVKQLLLSPAKGAKSLVETGNPVVSLLLIGIQAILSGIVTLIYVGFQMEMDLGTCFKYLVLSVFFSLLLMGITFGCSMLACICMKGTLDCKKALIALSLRCIAVIPFTFLAVPFSFILPAFGIGLVFICEIVGLFYQYFGFRAAFQLDEGKTSYISIIVSVVYMLAFILLIRLVASDLLSSFIWHSIY